MAAHLHKKPPHVNVQPWQAELVWRMEKLKGRFTKSKPLVTKETARTAQMKIYYNNSKILAALPAFRFTPLEQTIARVCNDFLQDVAAGRLSK
jgi:hypothetical protein